MAEKIVWNSALPTVSKVYPIRIYSMRGWMLGWAFFNALHKRWGELTFDQKEAEKKQWTADPCYVVNQVKQWHD